MSTTENSSKQVHFAWNAVEQEKNAWSKTLAKVLPGGTVVDTGRCRVIILGLEIGIAHVKGLEAHRIVCLNLCRVRQECTGEMVCSLQSAASYRNTCLSVPQIFCAKSTPKLQLSLVQKLNLRETCRDPIKNSLVGSMRWSGGVTASLNTYHRVVLRFDG